MRAYLYLIGAVVLEVCGTMMLPLSQNFTRLFPTLAILACYGGATYCLTFSLERIPLSIVYATWSGLGVFLVTLLGYVLYRQGLNGHVILGLFLIVAGVTLVNGFR